MSAPSKQLDQFVIRLPDGMRDRIRRAAEANNRSMNAEIVATLEEKYPVPKVSDETFAALAEVVSLMGLRPGVEIAGEAEASAFRRALRSLLHHLGISADFPEHELAREMRERFNYLLPFQEADS